MNKIITALMANFLIGFNLYGTDQFYVVNTTSSPVIVSYKSLQETKEQRLLAGQTQLIGAYAHPQQMIVRTFYGSCSYFSDIDMNSIYNYINIVPYGLSTALVYSDQSLNNSIATPKVTPILFLPDAIDKACSDPGSYVVRNRQTYLKDVAAKMQQKKNNAQPLIIQNKSAFPVTVELDLGNVSQMIDLQSDGTKSAISQIPSQTVYNLKIYAADGSCTKFSNIGMNSFFNRLYLEKRETPYYVVGYGHDDVAGSGVSPRPWKGSQVGKVYFQVSSNVSVSGSGEYTPDCWKKTTGEITESVKW